MTTGGPQVGHGDNELVGIYYGIVTRNLNDAAPGGRVWLKFPWLPEGDKDQLFMARLAVPMVGPGFGTYTVPEVGDQVLVVFVNGDIKQPIRI